MKLKKLASKVLATLLALLLGLLAAACEKLARCSSVQFYRVALIVLIVCSLLFLPFCALSPFGLIFFF